MMKKYQGMYPAPVYCALFADGSTMRMSFWSKVGKPLDYASGRTYCCAERGRMQEDKRSSLTDGKPDDAGYFESIEYRRVLRHYAQRLVDAVVTELCGSPMPITVKRVEARDRHGILTKDRRGKQVWKTHRCGYDSVPLFRTFLPCPAPAADIVDGWVEREDMTYPDPFFAPSAEVVQLHPKRRVQSDLDKALALLARLSDGDRAILAERMAA